MKDRRGSRGIARSSLLVIVAVAVIGVAIISALLYQRHNTMQQLRKSAAAMTDTDAGASPVSKL